MIKFSLPSSKEKKYLSGVDWVMDGLDRMSRDQLGVGHSFLISFELTGRFSDLKDFEERWFKYLEYFPELSGSVVRDFNLAPHVKFKKIRKKQSCPKMNKVKCSNSDLNEIYQNLLNKNFENDFPLQTVLVECDSTDQIVFIFDHRFFDAKGAEIFVLKFQHYFLNKKVMSFEGNNEACLDAWDEQFLGGKKINRQRLMGESASEIFTVAKERYAQSDQNHFILHTFSVNETLAIKGRADVITGPLMFLPYLLGVTIKIAYDILVKISKPEKYFIIPTTFDFRKALKKEKQSIFNCHSFLFFKLNLSAAKDTELIFNNIKDQVYSQRKEGLLKAFWDASMLMRIIPRRLYATILRGRGRFSSLKSSFSFASLGPSDYSEKAFLSSEIENIRHIPRVPPMPGMGVFFSEFGGKLNVVLSYLEGGLSDEDAQEIMEQIKGRL